MGSIAQTTLTKEKYMFKHFLIICIGLGPALCLAQPEAEPRIECAIFGQKEVKTLALSKLTTDPQDVGTFFLGDKSFNVSANWSMFHPPGTTQQLLAYGAYSSGGDSFTAFGPTLTITHVYGGRRQILTCGVK